MDFRSYEMDPWSTAYSIFKAKFILVKTFRNIHPIF